MFLKRTYSIREEVFFLGLFFSVVLFLIIGGVFSITYYKLSMEGVNRSLKGTSKEISIFMEGYFNEIANTLEVLSKNPDVISAGAGDEKSVARVLAMYHDIHTVHDNLAFVYSGYQNGLLLINNYTPPEGYRLTTRPWYIAAMEQKSGISVGFPYQDAVTGEWLISHSRALKNRWGDYHGVVAIDCYLDDVIALIRDRYLYQSQQAYIMDRDGMIIIHPDGSFIGETVAWSKEKITEKEGRFSYSPDNKKLLGHYNTIDPLGWVFVTAIDCREVSRPVIYRLLFFTLIAIGLALTLGMFQSRIFGRRFAKPLMVLGNRVADITRGKPRGEAAYRYSNREIARIAENIEKLAEDSLNKKTDELKIIIESTGDGILVVDADRQIVYVNSMFYEMWQIPRDVVLSWDDRVLLDSVLHQLLDPRVFAEKVRALYRSDSKSTDVLYFKDGRVFEWLSCPLLEESEVVGRLWNFHDITDRKKVEDKLRIMATTDDLTGLWNRRYFMQAAAKEIERAARYNQLLSILMIDIDHFKKINDTLGHAAGDLTLRHMAAVINDHMRRVDIPGRLGGEEFGILLPNTSLDDAASLAERLRRAIWNQPAVFKGKEILITVSIGVSAIHGGIAGVEEMLQSADEALYRAKACGRNCISKKI